MAPAWKATCADQLDRAWAELGEARWGAARALFEDALAAAETPEALEGLSWAAWWVDDAPVVFEAREGAHDLYRRRGDARGAARMATWLACDELDFHGAWAVASGWLGRARRLLEPVQPGPDHGWLAFFEGYLALQAGDTAATSEHARRAAELGRGLGEPDLEMLGLALEGATLVACARVEEGMRCLDEATATALQGQATIPISSAWACCFLVTACTAVRDYERAFEWCERIAGFAERYGSRYMLAFCRAEYGAVELWRGRWAEAEELLHGSIEDFFGSRPAWVGGPLRELAELRRRQGRFEEAAELLDRSGPGSAAQLCRARIALDRGDARQAVELAERCLRQAPPHRRLDRVAGLELLVRACTARGELEEAGAAVAALRDIEREVGTSPLRAGTDLTEALLAAARGDHDRARRLFEDAIDRFERTGGVLEAAEARVELATTMLAQGRRDVAEREASAALDRLVALGAEPLAARAGQVLRTCSGAAAEITPREREVLGLLAEGLTNRQIAERLVVSEHTVHRHVTNLLRKLDLPSRTAAAAHALRSGLLD